MEHCRSPDGVTSVSVRPYYTVLSRIYLTLAMGFLVLLECRHTQRQTDLHTHSHKCHWSLYHMPHVTLAMPAWGSEHIKQ